MSLKLPGRYYRIKFGLENGMADARARLTGVCNALASDGTPRSNGYNFWRCGLDRGHDGEHRFRNYLWSDGENMRYEPGEHLPGRYRDQLRNPHSTRIQRRNAEAWHRDVNEVKKRLARRPS